MWDTIQDRESLARHPAATVETVAARGERHTKRVAQRLGRWERHLLRQAEEAETAAGKKGVKRIWAPILLKPLGEGHKDPWTSAARAVRSLEEKGLVSVEPPFDPDAPKQRLVIRYYTLTPQGRRAAKQMQEPPEDVGPKIKDLRSRLQALHRRDRANWDAMLAESDFMARLRAQLEAYGEAADDDAIYWAARVALQRLQAMQAQLVWGSRGLQRVTTLSDLLPDAESLEQDVD